MAYDEELADRIRALLGDRSDIAQRRMFGGLAFLVRGNMAVGVSGGGGIMVRVDPDEAEQLLREPHTRPFEMRGRPARGWLRVELEGVAENGELEAWVRRGVAYASSLPAKN